MSYRQLIKSLPFLFLLGLGFLVGCSDTTDPGTEPGDGTGRIDPDAAERIDPNDSQRIQRALPGRGADRPDRGGRRDGRR